MNQIIQSFGLNPESFTVQPLTSGHIHATYKLIGTPSFVLQRVNKKVFTQPGVIASNLRVAADYLKQQHPGYLFLSSVSTLEGQEMSYDSEGYPWRLFPYIENSITVDRVETVEEAFQAAAAFAKLTYNLEGININLFKPTIDGFHDLSLRYLQFEKALANSTPERLKDASEAVKACRRFQPLVQRYDELIRQGTLKLRITHNDTKINNILLDAKAGLPICVIDLDTLMPGYFIYDLGDMVRTFVSPVDEEEKDLTRVVFRKPIYDALVAGYLSQMGKTLSKDEMELIPFAGLMMTYIMALRMLSDFLNGDVYYHTTYPGQNLVRARNQLRLLEVLSNV